MKSAQVSIFFVVTDHHIVSREITINIGHRIPIHQSPCSGIHGHAVEVQVLCSVDDQSGQPPDCAFLDDVLHAEIIAPCDGGMLLWTDDPLSDVLRPHVLMGISLVCVDQQGFWEGSGEFGKLYLLPCVPSAENLARHWFERLAEPVRHYSGQRVELVGVKVCISPDMEATFGPMFELKLTAS